MTRFSIKQSGRSGQTVIEAILAISILTTGFLGIITLLSKSFFIDRVTTDTTKATYLASEGIEIAKNLVDHDVYAHLANPPQGLGWGACFSGYPSAATIGFEMDYATVDCNTLVPYSDRPIMFDPNTGMYGYNIGSGGVPTNFTRRIRVSQSGDLITVNTIVSWSTGPLTSQSVNLEDHFYNWHP